MNAVNRKEIGLLLIILLFGALLMSFQWGDPVDDAYVSFVYARNLADGHDLTFNPGEKVEGYSNFLWVVMLAASHRFIEIPVAAQLLGFLFGLANILLLYFIGRRCGLGTKALIPAALLASDLRSAVWCVEGLETPLYVFLILLTIFIYLKERSPLWAVPALLAAMTRPDGAAVGALALHRTWLLIKGRQRPEKRDWIAAALFCAGFIVYNAWRISYFEGSILPNTFYARGGANGPILGFLYIVFSMWNGWRLSAIVLGAMTILGLCFRNKVQRRDGALAAWLVVGKLVVLVTGGDWMPNGRFLVPLLPFVYYFYVIGIQALPWPRVGSFLITLLVATNLAGVAIYGHGNSFEKRWSRQQASFYMPVANWLTDHGARGKKVVLSDVGYITYYSGIRAIDTLGLTNRHLARIKGGSAWATDINYVLEQNPEYIIRMARDYGDGKELGHTAFDREVINDARFQKGYTEVAAIPGYQARERALGDFELHSYKVTFRIYSRASP